MFQLLGAQVAAKALKSVCNPVLLSCPHSTEHVPFLDFFNTITIVGQT